MDLRFPLAMSGRGDSTQEHASKEEVAPVGVTVVRNGDAYGVDIFSPSSWEPQEEGMMNIAARFSLS
jgi:hypothetical protein